MKKELEYFMIDGEFGGNQDWFTNIVMNVGGCGAATACDSCIYLAKYKGMKKLYPFDLEQMDKEAYKKGAEEKVVDWFAVVGVIAGAVVANVVSWGIASINGMVVAAVIYVIGEKIRK